MPSIIVFILYLSSVILSFLLVIELITTFFVSSFCNLRTILERNVSFFNLNVLLSSAASVNICLLSSACFSLSSVSVGGFSLLSSLE